MSKKILFITGSLNQTTQMHQVANYLSDYDCWFSQIFADSPVINWIIENTSIADRTVMSNRFKEKSELYCREHNLKTDYKAQLNHYDLVIYCSDLIIPDRMLQTKTLWIQEGMVDEITAWTKIVKALHLPPYLSIGTALNGASNICDVYCAASEGYKSHFSSLGTNPDKLISTGIPNFDNCQHYLKNDFPYQDYVLVCTSDVRECYRPDNRVAFIQNCVKIAAGRPLIFKIHPNEIIERAIWEIKENTPPNTLILDKGNTNEMIANCVELITQYSTVVYVGIALNKKVHSYFEVETLKKQAPIQNNGTSAKNIAKISKAFLAFEGKKENFVSTYHYTAESSEELSAEYAI